MYYWLFKLTEKLIVEMMKSQTILCMRITILDKLLAFSGHYSQGRSETRRARGYRAKVGPGDKNFSLSETNFSLSGQFPNFRNHLQKNILAKSVYFFPSNILTTLFF